MGPKIELKLSQDELNAIEITKRELNVLIERRNEIFASVTLMLDSAKECSADDIHLLQAYYDDLANQEAKFDQVTDKIIQNNVALPESHREKIPSTTGAFHSLLMKIKAIYLKFKCQQPVALQTHPTNVASNPHTPHLPKLEIPIFDGNVQNWPSYIALFNTLVHENPSLGPAHKFRYLISTLKGDARSIISGLEITDENYNVAYDALSTRYQNKRRLVSMYLSQILNFKPGSAHTLSELKNFLAVHQNSINAIKALQMDNLEDFLLLYLVQRNMAPKLKSDFELKHDPNTVPTVDELIEFITHQIRTLELSESTSLRPNSSKIHRSQALIVNSPPNTSNDNFYQVRCPLCNCEHSISQCNRYTSLSVNDKYRILKKHRRCFNCLGAHPRNSCQSESSCRECFSTKHHSSLHKFQAANSAPKPTNNRVPSLSVQHGKQVASPVASSEQSKTCASLTMDSSHQVLLGTAYALISDVSGQYHPVRGVIDPGSQISAVTERCLKRLQLPLVHSSTNIAGISQCNTRPIGQASITVKSRFSPRTLNFNAVVLKSITGDLPSVSLSHVSASQFRNLRLADPNFRQSSPIDFLIGADLFPEILITHSKPISGYPSAINSFFGWLIIGPVYPEHQFNSPDQTQAVSLLSTRMVSEQLKKFWEIEQINVEVPPDPLDQYVEDHFCRTHTRDSSGRYMVSLPFKPDSIPLQSNRSFSYSSVLRLEKRLLAKPLAHSQYHEFMSEYLNLDHMSAARQAVPYIIPHHVVYKDDPVEGKIRVVFNASQPDSNGICLNQQLLKGPKLQKDIGTVLLSFRLLPVALCCDIQKMYRQILIAPSDRCHQHIYWRPHPDSKLQEFELNTVTYGLTPSAFQAQRVLLQLVKDHGSDYPLAAQAITQSTYVDDVISGAQDVQSALILREQLSQLLKLGGFELRKWSSSHAHVLQGLEPTHIESKLVFSDPERTVKILGINWLPSEDAFTFRATAFTGDPTKRRILSFIAKSFDPLGLIAPIIVSQKIFLQRLWLLETHWDESLSEDLQRQWNSITAHVEILQTLRIPRCVLPSTLYQVSMIGFADASELAYAAAVYLCFQTDTSRTSWLWKAKTKVAPLKKISIPRLELSAAVMLAELASNLIQCGVPFSLQSIRLFSDSELTLHWINSAPHLFHTFVANRIARIQELALDSTSWAHIPTNFNPADLPSRGLTPHQLLSPPYHDLWYHGPPLLNDVTIPWPRSFTFDPSKQFQESERKVAQLCTLATPPNHLSDVIRKFSSFSKLQRVLAWILRFIRNAKISANNPGRTSGPLTLAELNEATTLAVRLTQEENFSHEISLLRQGKLPKPLKSLTPFIDERGLLRVGGRLANSALALNAKHPILLPKRAHLSSLLCDFYHLLTLHAGPSTSLAQLRQNFWIMSGRTLMRHRINACRTCHLFRGRTIQPLMADLPSCRVTPSRPFLVTGVDFAGPFPLKLSSLRNSRISKCYLCLFVCTSTKAIHLETVSDLSTSAFMASLTRFIARRGLPQRILSDQGRNFIGANHRLREVEQFFKSNSSCIFEQLSARSIKWDFNPPHAPNFGGLWEAGVKSAKRLLLKQFGTSAYTFEEYATIFSRIEAALNSRPLYPLSSDPNEPLALTPGHFLIGTPLLDIPDPSDPENVSIADRWRRMSQQFQSFWRLWTKEYLNSLMQRLKWTSSSATISEGDVVFLKSPSTLPLTWPIARVKELHPGGDGIARVATIITPQGEYVRPVSSLIPLSDE